MISMKNFPLIKLSFVKVDPLIYLMVFSTNVDRFRRENVKNYPPSGIFHVASKCLVCSRSPRSKNVTGIAQIKWIQSSNSKTAEENEENIINVKLMYHRAYVQNIIIK